VLYNSLENYFCQAESGFHQRYNIANNVEVKKSGGTGRLAVVTNTDYRIQNLYYCNEAAILKYLSKKYCYFIVLLFFAL